MGLFAAALAIGLGQLVKAVTGFGSGLVAMPVLLVVFGPAEAILLLGVCDLIAGGVLVADVRSRISLPLVGALLAGVFPGQWAGTELLVLLDPVWVARALGVVVAALGATIAWRPVVEGRGELTGLPADARALLGTSVGIGLLSGVLGGLVGAGGPPLVMFVRRHFEPQFLRAQLLTTFFCSSLVLVPMLVARGTDVGVLWALPWMLGPLVLGNRLGRWLAGVVPREAFGRLTGFVLVGAGLALLAR